jgi:hypothetical protein
VEGVPAGHVLGQQVRPGQLGQGTARLRAAGAAQACRRGHRDVRARMQAQQPEHPRRRLAQLPVGPGEHLAHAAGGVRGLQHVQAPVPAAQFRGQCGQPEARARGGTRRHDGQAERQPGAQPGEVGHRLGLGLGTCGTEPPGDQLAGLGLRHDVQGEDARPHRGDQAVKPVPAGDHDGAPPAAGQQRPHLVGVAGVVQQDQHPLPGQDAAVQGRLRVGRLRDLGTRHAQRLQEAADRLPGRDRTGGRVEALEVDVELPVGEVASRTVGPDRGQRALAHAGGSDDRPDPGLAAGLGALADQLVEPGKFRDAVDELCGRRRKLARHRPRPHRQIPPGARVLAGRRPGRQG